jgi:hypothetical protein
MPMSRKVADTVPNRSHCKVRTYIIDDVLNIPADILYVIVKQTMKKKTHYIIVCCMMTLVILSLAGFDVNANALPRNVTWKQVNTDHFRLLYDERHRDVVQSPGW